MSNNNIIKQIETRLKTTMIGSLARFESAFGHLWEDDDEYADIWEDVRTSILNNGNHQIRMAIDDLEQFIYHRDERLVIENKYRYKFYPKQDRRNDED
jgi:hypothetical protein